MKIVLHTGAHYTEEDRLMKCLLRNKEDLAKRHVAVPGPGRYRRLLRETMNAIKDAPPAPGARDVLLDAILDQEVADRIVLSHSHFFGVPRAALQDGFLYPLAAERLTRLSRLFPNDEIEMYMAIQNPATFLPAVFDKAPVEEMITFLDGIDPREVAWSEMFSHLRTQVPDIPITVWCNEDAPLIWAQIIREMAGLPDGTKIIGGFDLLSEIMSREGMRRFRAYLKTHPVMSEAQKRRVMGAFLDKFAMEDALEEVVDLPGWTEALVDDLTERYDDDVQEIAEIPGLRMILP